MANIKTSELTGLALDWAVAQCEWDRLFRVRIARPDNWDQAAYLENGSDDRWQIRAQVPNVAWFADYAFWPSVDWSQAGPIIERERISVDSSYTGQWVADTVESRNKFTITRVGPTPLVAAMRCYVASKMGATVDVPDVLIAKG